MPSTSSSQELVHSQCGCWDQLLRLLSNRSFYLTANQWPEFQKQIIWHHVQVDAFNILSEHPERHEFSTNQIGWLKNQVWSARKHWLTLSRVQGEMSSLLYQSGIRHLFFKGLVLGQWLYGDNEIRECRDLDIIVDRTEFSAACKTLEAHGFKRIYPDTDLSPSAFERYQNAMKDVGYCHSETGKTVELHWRLSTLETLIDFDFGSAYQDRKEVKVGQWLVPAFSDVLTLRYLPLHGDLSNWGRLRWLLDWYLIMEKQSINWPEVWQELEHRVERIPMAHAFRLTKHLFDVQTPGNIQTPKMQWSCRKITEAMSKRRYPLWIYRKLLLLNALEKPSSMLAYAASLARQSMAASSILDNRPQFPQGGS